MVLSMSFSFRSSWFSLALHDPAFRPRIAPGKSLVPNPEPAPVVARGRARAQRSWRRVEVKEARSEKRRG
jgi:hypothetical protein